MPEKLQFLKTKTDPVIYYKLKIPLHRDKNQEHSNSLKSFISVDDKYEQPKLERPAKLQSVVEIVPNPDDKEREKAVKSVVRIVSPHEHEVKSLTKHVHFDERREENENWWEDQPVKKRRRENLPEFRLDKMRNKRNPTKDDNTCRHTMETNDGDLGSTVNKPTEKWRQMTETYWDEGREIKPKRTPLLVYDQPTCRRIVSETRVVAKNYDPMDYPTIDSRGYQQMKKEVTSKNKASREAKVAASMLLSAINAAKRDTVVDAKKEAIKTED